MSRILIWITTGFGAKPIKPSDKGRHDSLKYVSSSSEVSDFHPQGQKSPTGDQPVKYKGESMEAHKPMTSDDLKQNNLAQSK